MRAGSVPPPRRVAPGPGQESVWDYPRPPRVEPTTRHVVVEFAGVRIADSRRALRVLETSLPPSFYIPPEDVRRDLLVPTRHATVCEWKGRGVHWDVVAGEQRAERAAWGYPDPEEGYGAIKDHVSFYPARVDACLVDGERVQAQEGGYYGGWITGDLVGPIKGAPGTEGW